jgi:hypothetical protein
MNLLTRIQQGLLNRAGTWIHSHVIYTKLHNEGYTSDSIKRALDTIHHTPPFAMIRVDGDDYRTLEQMGVHTGGYYYTAHPTDATRAQESLDAFDAL